MIENADKLFCGFNTEENNLLKMDGFDDCIVGIVERYGCHPLVCYSRKRVIQKLIQDGMSEDEANEFFEYSQLGAFVGEKTPCFLTENS